MSIALDALIVLSGWTHVLLSPFTKVEESFNLHATHDVLMYGVAPDALPNYDHFTFPGAIPRTFIGSVLLAWISYPAIRVAAYLGLVPTKFEIQIITRLVLATVNALTLVLIRRAVSRRFGRPTSLLFALLTCSQFHFPFWMGRTIPNMYASIPVNIATYLRVDRPARPSSRASKQTVKTIITLLVLASAIFRAEVALLLLPLCLQLLWNRQIGFWELVKTGVTESLIAVGVTMAVDSYFWGRFVWPEFAGIWFNVVEGKSSEWGTSPPLTYLTTHLPKLLLSSLPLAILGLAIDSRIRSLLFPAIIFIALISGLGHKEWRFIVYVVPVFNVGGARGLRGILSLRNRFLRALGLLTAFTLLASNLVFTAFSTYASMRNYPGGEALVRIHQLVMEDHQPPPHIHISNLAAQTGASLFLHLNAPPSNPALVSPLTPNPNLDRASPVPLVWRYNKTEGLTPSSFSSSFSSSSFSSSSSSRDPHPITHLISELPPSRSAVLDREWRELRTLEWHYTTRADENEPAEVVGFDRVGVDTELLGDIVEFGRGVVGDLRERLRRGVNWGEKGWDGKREEARALMGRLGGLVRWEESAKLWILERKPAS